MTMHRRESRNKICILRTEEHTIEIAVHLCDCALFPSVWSRAPHLLCTTFMNFGFSLQWLMPEM